MTLLTLLGGGLPKLILQAYQQRLDAANDADRIAADETIARLEGARALSVIEAGDRWSATRIGRLLIVVPFGIWWTAIFIVSTFHLDFVVLAVPQNIMAMAQVLVPAILIASVAEKFKR